VGRIPEKPTIWNWLLRQDLSGIHSCRTLLEGAAKACLGRDPVSAAAYTEATATAFWNYVVEASADHAARGISTSFAIADNTTKTWDCYPVPTGANSLKEEKALRVRSRPTYLRMIDNLNDRQFEALSCVLLEALGSSEVELTKGGGEGGIDAFGLILNADSSHILGSPHHPLRVIAQSKMQSRPMGADKMKEFFETINEVKYGGEHKTEEVIPHWFRSSRGPIIGMAISDKGFQGGAEKRARSRGILIVDSIDIAEVLATTRTKYSSPDACLARIAELLAKAPRTGPRP
jgi:hypothetical protein